MLNLNQYYPFSPLNFLITDPMILFGEVFHKKTIREFRSVKISKKGEWKYRDESVSVVNNLSIKPHLMNKRTVENNAINTI